MNNRLQQLQDNIINLLRNDREFISNRPQNFSEDVEQFFDMLYNEDVLERNNAELEVRRAIEVNYNDMQDFYNARIANTRHGESNAGIDEIIWGDIANYVDSLVNQPVQNNIPQILQQPLLQHVPQINIGNIQQQNIAPQVVIQQIQPQVQNNIQQTQPIASRTRTQDGTINRVDYRGM